MSASGDGSTGLRKGFLLAFLLLLFQTGEGNARQHGQSKAPAGSALAHGVGIYPLSDSSLISVSMPGMVADKERTSLAVTVLSLRSTTY